MEPRIHVITLAVRPRAGARLLSRSRAGSVRERSDVRVRRRVDACPVPAHRAGEGRQRSVWAAEDHRGDLPEAARVVALFDELDASADGQEQAVYACGKARLLLAEGNPSEALRFAESRFAARETFGFTQEYLKELGSPAPSWRGRSPLTEPLRLLAGIPIGEPHRCVDHSAEPEHVPQGRYVKSLIGPGQIPDGAVVSIRHAGPYPATRRESIECESSRLGSRPSQSSPFP